MTTHLYYEICSWLARLIKGSKWDGHVFAVGGCCRDEILGRDIKDLDLAVDIPGGGVDFARWLHRKRLTVGSPTYFLKFGTARLVLKKWPGEEIELVQTRSEKYTDRNSRCPEVAAGSIHDDCFRRDFTVNTLYRDITNDRLLDLTGRGVADIKRGLLRTPMDPDVTFDDDPVRILRCIRFATRFGWEIESDTLAALRRNIGRLSIVSRERRRGELSKMLAGNNPVAAISMLRDLDALCHMLPLLGELSGHRAPGKAAEPDTRPADIAALWDRAVEHLGRISDHDLPLRLAALFAECGKLRVRVRNKKGVVSYPNYEMVGANMARRALRAIKFEPHDLDDMAFLIQHQNDMALWGEYGELMTDKALRHLQHKAVTDHRFGQLLALSDALRGYDEPSPLTQRVAQRTAEMQAEGSDLFNRRIPAESLDSHLANPPRNPKRNPRRRDNRGRQQ